MNEKIRKNIPLIIFLAIVFGPALLKNKGFFILVLLTVFFVLFKNNKLPLGQIFNNKKNMSETIDMDALGSIKKIKQLILSTVLILLLLWLFFASIVIIDAGETGVYSLFGRVKDNELGSGFHLVIPLAKVTKMSIRTEEYTMSVSQGEGKRIGADAIAALTKEGLNLDLDITVLYKLQEEKASDIYSEIGLNYEEKIIRPIIRTAIRDIIAQYEAKDIYSKKREEATDKIKEKLAQSMGERGISIENVLLRNVKLPANLAQAIQEKLGAEQEAEKYDFILQKEKKEKERKIIEAEGQRDAQKIINESLSTNYLYYLYISDLKSREGTIYVPTNPSTGMPLFRDLGR